MERAELARLLGAEVALQEPPAEPVVIAEREPERFMAAFTAAVASGAEVFLADPTWSDRQRAELRAVLEVTGHENASPPSRLAGGGIGWLMIPSGGTSGRLKFARHDQDTIAAAVRGFCAHFGGGPVNAVGVLPLHHVSGLMAWLRCVLSGGRYLAWDWKKLDRLERPAGLAPRETVISLVPTQLQRLLASREAVAWLRGLRAIFVGGGPAWPELLEAAARAELPVALSYGMTETAAMVTALRPAEFLAGARSSGPALPHARVTIDGEGAVHIAAESLFRGYYPAREAVREFVPGDLGRLDAAGHLHVLGRRDAMIITGGKKVQPAEVEAALQASGEFTDVAVIGVPDAEWGEAVVACYPAAGGREPDLARATLALAGWQRPKRFVALAEWPRNAQGKINRAALLELVRKRP
jgi:O-succinylbenzoic acid--CoA ligase